MVIAFLPIYILFRSLLWTYGKSHGRVLRENGEVLGSEFVCFLPDLIQRQIYLFGIWEPDITSFVKRRLAPGDNFIDVGSHVGYYAALASEIVGTTGRVVAIEASPLIYKMLLSNLRLNGRWRNIRGINVAVSASEERLAVYRPQL